MKEEEWKALVKRMSDDVRALNIDLTGKTDAACAASVPQAAVPTAAIVKLTGLWQLIAPDLVLEPEHRFARPRRWRFDFAHLPSLTAIEYNGGVWGSGRHVRGRGYLADREKINTAISMGWVVFELGTGQIEPELLAAIARTMRARQAVLSKGDDNDIPAPPGARQASADDGE